MPTAFYTSGLYACPTHTLDTSNLVTTPPVASFPHHKGMSESLHTSHNSETQGQQLHRSKLLEHAPITHLKGSQTAISRYKTPVVHSRQQTRGAEELSYHRLGCQSLHKCCDPHFTDGTCPTIAHVCTCRNGSIAIHVAVDAATTSNRDVAILTDGSTLIWNLIGLLHVTQRYAGINTLSS